MKVVNQTHVHQFENGNACSLTLNWDGSSYKDSHCFWKRAPEWKVIDAEYKQWSFGVMADFYSALPPEALAAAAVLGASIVREIGVEFCLSCGCPFRPGSEECHNPECEEEE